MNSDKKYTDQKRIVDMRIICAKARIFYDTPTKQERVVLKKETRPNGGIEGYKKGKKAEEQFFQAWRFGVGISIRRATKEEDLFERTDAILTMKNADEFKIQIKSFPTSPKAFTKFLNEGIVLLSILPDESPKTIRKNTINALCLFVQESNKRKKAPL